MIFAELDYKQEYQEFHDELVAFVVEHFQKVQSGIQCDSWVWILDGEEKVAIDTFSSMKHQIKSDLSGPHVHRVIEALLLKYRVNIYEAPKLEEHEDN